MQAPTALDTVLAQPATGTWPEARFIIAGVVALAALCAVAVFCAEFLTIRKAGGLKSYAREIDMVTYNGLRTEWTLEVILGALTVAIMLRAFVPNLVSTLQIDAVWAVIIAAASAKGINLAGFGIKQVNADPAVMVAAAAIKDPDVQPLVTTNKKTGDTTVSVVPSALATANIAAAQQAQQQEAAAAQPTIEPSSLTPREAVAEPAVVLPPKPAEPVFERDG
jgi:hypothetical protein